MSSVSLSAIVKTYGSARILKGVSLDIREGEFLTLVGPSGCGKSTLLRIIAGLEAQDSGEVRIGERNVDALRPKARDIAMVFQSYALYPHMSVQRNMAVPLVMRRLSPWQRLPLIGRLLPHTAALRAGIDAEVRDVARALEIEPLLARKPGQLSGGQRQRVAVGRAMVRRPSVFLMDEPLSNLDAKLRVQMRAEIKELHARLGITFIYVTHDQSEAMTMSTRVALMMEGEIVQIAAPEVLYAEPENVRAAAFIGSPGINLVDGIMGPAGDLMVAGTVVRSGLAEPPGLKVTLGIRPELLALGVAPGPGTLAGRLRLVEHLGSDLLVHVDLNGSGGPVIARLNARMHPDLRPGAIVHLVPEMDGCLYFDADGQRLRPATTRVLPQRVQA